MEIYCNNNALLERAVKYSRVLGIESRDARIVVKRLPPSYTKSGFIEHPSHLDNDIYISIYVKLDNDRYITLAHEMVHARQVLNGQPIDEKEAYLLENILDNDPTKMG